MRLILPLLSLLPGRATGCDLALLLAMDISGSVDINEYRIQRDGLAAALRDPIVSEALVRAEAKVAVLQWTGRSRQLLTVDWHAVPDFDALEALAVKVETDQRMWRNFSTAVGEALSVSVDILAQVPECRRKVVDVSGDGESNEGVEPRGILPRLRAAGITVNALAIETDEDIDLTAWFFEHVITGEGAFVATAQGFEDYPRAIRDKLRRETTLQLAGMEFAPDL